jgi:hypothetical protein
MQGKNTYDSISGIYPTTYIWSKQGKHLATVAQTVVQNCDLEHVVTKVN